LSCGSCVNDCGFRRGGAAAISSAATRPMACNAKARVAWRLVDVALAPDSAIFSFTLDRAKLRQARRREGRCGLRLVLTHV